MGDPFSVASGVVGIISLGIQVGETLFKYYSSYKDQNKTVHRFVTRLEKLLCTLKSLDTVLNDRYSKTPSGHSHQLGNASAQIQQIESSILDCKGLIDELQVECDKITTAPSHDLKGAIRVAGRRILYPLRESTLTKLDEDIESVRDTLTLAVTVLQLSDGQQIRHDVLAVRQLVETIQATQLSAEIQHWLDAPDAIVNHNIASAKRHAESGLWFINGSQFSSWMREENSFLWLRGFAGTGKSVLCSTAIQATFQQQQQINGSSSTAIAFFYFTFNDVNKQRLSSMLQAVLQQLAHQCPGGNEDLETLYKDSSRNMRSDESMLSCLQNLIGRVDNTYLFLDALDEVPQGEQRQELLEAIETIRLWLCSGLHLLVTSRDIVEIRDGLQVQPQTEVVMSNKDIDNDINNFVTSRLKSDFQLSKWSIHHDKIRKTLTDKACGVWIECQLDAVRRCPRSEKRLDQCLNSLPKTLDEIYERVLSVIGEASEDSKRDALRILTALCYSFRPLTVLELADAVAVNLEEPAHLDRRLRLTDADSLLEICPGLIEVYIPETDNENAEEGSPAEQPAEVRIAHFSVQEYLESTRQRTEHSRYFALNSSGGHAEMARICLAYLQDPCLDRHIEKGEDLKDVPLCTYAAEAWLPHYEHAERDQISLRPLIMQLFTSSPKRFENSIRLSNPDVEGSRYWQFDRPDDEIGGPLYFASLHGLEWIVNELLASGADVNAIGGHGESALVAASLNGKERIMRLLIERGADLNPCAYKYGNALLISCQKGNYDGVKLLIEHGADVNDVNIRGTPLSVASAEGYEEIVTFLLEHGAEIDLRDRDGTPLQAAASEGQESIVRLLLQNGADPLDKGGRSGTAIQAAGRGGNLQIVQLLLDLDVDINAQNGQEGATALFIASNNGDEEMVRLLLEKGADVNLQSNRGSPLMAASRLCIPEIVELLLDYGADINARHEWYGSALNAALRTTSIPLSDGKFASTYTLLLDRGADIFAEDQYNWSAFHTAFFRGLEDVACIFLDKFIFPSNDREHYFEALRIAARNQHTDLVRAILDRGSAVGWMSVEECRTAIEDAAELRSIETFSLLLNCVAKEDREGLRNDALLIAIRSMHVHRVEDVQAKLFPMISFLLDQGADIHFQGDKGGNVFQAALLLENVNLVCMLIDRGLSVDSGILNTELLHVEDNAHRARFLVSIGADVKVQHPEYHNATALHRASYHGHEDMIDFLLEQGADIDAQDELGQTPLHYAVSREKITAVKFLLSKPVSVNVVAEVGTALDIATDIGNDSLVRLLVEKGAKSGIPEQ